MSTFVIVPGAWDTPADDGAGARTAEVGRHTSDRVDLPCGDADATLERVRGRCARRAPR